MKYPAVTLVVIRSIVVILAMFAGQVLAQQNGLAIFQLSGKTFYGFDNHLRNSLLFKARGAGSMALSVKHRQGPFDA